MGRHWYLEEWIFSEFEPLSNWSSSLIAFNAHRHSNVEQGSQHQNALHFNDTVSAAKIIASNSPLEAFKLGKKVNMIDPKNTGQKSIYTKVHPKH